jgi:tetratricopeptide (TPR) repeat protein
MKRLPLVLLIYLLIAPGNLFGWNAEEMITLFRRGERLYNEGKYKEAIIEFEKVLDISPDNILVTEHKRQAEDKLRLMPALEARREKERRVWQEQENIREKLDRLRQQRYKKQFEQGVAENLKLEAAELKLTKELQEKLQGQKFKNLAELERIKTEQQRVEMKKIIEAEAQKLKKLEEEQERAFFKAEAESLVLSIKGYREEEGGRDGKKSRFR